MLLLLSNVGARERPLFDVIVSNPPYFPGEPRDLADRAWHSGPPHRDILELFVRARGLPRPPADKRSIMIDTFVIYELQTG